ncbi:MAG: hypothetical protein H3C41_04165 [Bacteroidales bacterium]|nr:hypothetical protein [Bacteroidales bacterium]
MKSNIIKIALSVVIVVLVYLIYKSINEPIQFLNEKKLRDVEVVQRLKDIRSIQAFYKNAKGKYSGSFDSLLAYVKVGEIPVVNVIPDPNDTTFTKTINDTLGYVKVADSLFGKRHNFNLSNLGIIPFSDNVPFELAAGEVERGGVKVSVYEVKAPFTAYLKGLDEQRILNLIANEEAIEKYAGLKVGSLTEPSTDGNWE